MILVHFRMAAVTKDTETVVQKGLSEWWNEETEYMFQRIERWAAFARGYNRLRSQRLSKNWQQMQEHYQDSSWNASIQRSRVNEVACSPRFYRERSRRKTRPEETRINCCGTFNYQSNSKLDSNCLETYRYDHSIYFKTIGDIRNDKKDIENCNIDKVSISSEEQVEWDASSLTDFLTNKSIVKKAYDNNYLNNGIVSETVLETKIIQATQNVWPIVDLANLNLTDTSRLPRSIGQSNRSKRERTMGKQQHRDSGNGEHEF